MVQERTKDGSLTTEGQSLILSTGEMAQAALQVSGTWTGTLSIEGTVDGTNWFSLNSSDPATGLIATSLTANGQYVTNVGGLNAIRVRSSAAMTGTAKVAIRATLAGAGNGATGESSVFPSNYAVDDSAMPATPNVLPVGAEYRASATTYTDGDATVLQSDVNGRLKTAANPGSYAVDDSAMPATPNIMPIGGEYRSAADTYTDGDAVVAHFDVAGNLKVSNMAALSATDDTVGVRPDDYATDDTAMPATPRVVPVAAEYRQAITNYADGDATVLQAGLGGDLRTNSLNDFRIVTCTPSAFDGATLNARGDEGGTSDPYTLFTVTGDVLMAVYGVCTTDLAGSGLVSVGPAGNPTLMMAALAGTSIDQSEVWMDATPAIGKTIDGLTFYIVGNGVDIVEDITTDTITSGNIYYVCLWKPLSAGSSVVSAV